MTARKRRKRHVVEVHERDVVIVVRLSVKPSTKLAELFDLAAYLGDHPAIVHYSMSAPQLGKERG